MDLVSMTEVTVKRQAQTWGTLLGYPAALSTTCALLACNCLFHP